MNNFPQWNVQLEFTFSQTFFLFIMKITKKKAIQQGTWYLGTPNRSSFIELFFNKE